MQDVQEGKRNYLTARIFFWTRSGIQRLNMQTVLLKLWDIHSQLCSITLLIMADLDSDSVGSIGPE